MPQHDSDHRSDRERAEILNRYAQRLVHRGGERELHWYRRAAQADPTWAAPWFNLGLVHKYRGEWAESLQANRAALERQDDHGGACWNLGIAATALHDWNSAREAWRRYGLALPAGDGPIDAQLGAVAIRLDPEDGGEVVWADRIDPARARILNVPLPGSGHRYRDIVLHDGSVQATRKVEGREYPVFNALGLWQASAYATFEALIETAAPETLAALVERVREGQGENAGQVEDWTHTVRYLCQACSEGEQDHEHPQAPAAHTRFQLGIAATDEAWLRGVLDDWLGQHPQARLLEFGRAFPADVTP
jgi:tetratricopeptide (TPR) repeat protein